MNAEARPRHDGTGKKIRSYEFVRQKLKRTSIAVAQYACSMLFNVHSPFTLLSMPSRRVYTLFNFRGKKRRKKEDFL